MGEGIGRRSADREARRFRVAVSRQGARDAAAVPGRSPSRTQDARRRRDVPDVQPLRLQPEPARVLDRHAAAHVRAVPARRSPAPERRHRHRRVGEPGAALQGDLRRRGDLRAVAAPRLRHRVDDRGAHQGQPEGERCAPRPPRHELVEQRRQDLLRNRARNHRPRDGLHRAARQGGEDVRRTEVRAARRPTPARDPHRAPAGAARPDLDRAPLRRHGAGRREDAAVREQRRRAAPGGSRDVVPRPLPPHEDQAAVSRLEPGEGRVAALRRRCRPQSTSIGRTTRPTTSAASDPTRQPCATRTRRSCSCPGWA